MGKVIITDTYLSNIADAIRNKTGTQITYKPSQMAAAISNIPSGGGSPKVGGVRSDAELVQSWTYDKLLHNDEGITIPSYTTSATTLKASETLGTVTIDLTNYRYLVSQRFLSIPQYTNGTNPGSGMVDFYLHIGGTELIFIPQNAISTINGNTTCGNSYNAVALPGTSFLVYWTSGTAASIRWSSGYSIYCTLGGHSYANGILTVKSPTISIRGNTTYFKQAYMNATEDAWVQHVTEVWRIPVSSGVLGWEEGSQVGRIIDCVNDDQVLY